MTRYNKTGFSSEFGWFWNQFKASEVLATVGGEAAPN